MSQKDYYWKFVPGEYLQDTQHLETDEHGAYFLLMLHYVSTGKLPEDDHQLARITQLSLKSFRRIKPIIQAFFYDGWKHKRIEADFEARRKEKANKSKGGRRSAEVKALKRLQAASTGVDGKVVLFPAQPNQGTLPKSSRSFENSDDKKLSLDPTNPLKILDQSSTGVDVLLQQNACSLELELDKDSDSSSENNIQTVVQPPVDQPKKGLSGDADFDLFWKAYPRRDGRNPKAPALTKFKAAVKKGADPKRIIAGAERYAAEEFKRVGTPYIARATTWLNDKGWEDYTPMWSADTAPPDPALPPEPGIPSIEELRAKYAERNPVAEPASAGGGFLEEGAGLRADEDEAVGADRA